MNLELSGAPLPVGPPVTRRSSHPIVTPLDMLRKTVPRTDDPLTDEVFPEIKTGSV